MLSRLWFRFIYYKLFFAPVIHQVDASFIGCSFLAKNWCSCPSLLSLLPQPLRGCLIAHPLAISVMPSMLKALHSDCPAKPGLPTSTGRFQVFNLCCLHASINAWYLALFLSCASSILSSHGTVSSRRTICFDILDSSKISGLSFVLAISAGNFSWTYIKNYKKAIYLYWIIIIMKPQYYISNDAFKIIILHLQKLPTVLTWMGQSW